MCRLFLTQYFGSDLLGAVSRSARHSVKPGRCCVSSCSMVSDIRSSAGLQRCSPCSSRLTHPVCPHKTRLSPQTRLTPQTRLSVTTPSVSSRASSARLLLLFLLDLSVSVSVGLLSFFFLSRHHNLSLSDLSLAPGRRGRQHTLSLESDRSEDDSYEKLQPLIKGLNS